MDESEPVTTRKVVPIPEDAPNRCERCGWSQVTSGTGNDKPCRRHNSKLPTVRTCVAWATLAAVKKILRKTASAPAEL